MVLIAKPKEFIPHELCAIVDDDGVWHPKSMDDIAEEEHGLLRFDLGDQPCFYPL
jgi:hypothetical protein